MSNQVMQVGPSWRGLAAIKRLMVFGDSYSAVGAPIEAPRTAAHPLGVPFPGPGCFTDYDNARHRSRPNWVGHFITQYAPEPRYRDIAGIQAQYPGYTQEQDPAYARDPLLVYDYARGGKTIPEVISQIEDQFLPRLGKWCRTQPAEGAGKGGDAAKVWTSENALFVTWVGINDCAFGSTREAREEAFQQLFAAQDDLYQAGARNFVFIDVPHINRMPISHKDRSERYDEYNAMLAAHARRFATAHPDATVLLFSSARTLDRVLDDPDIFGFPQGDAREPFSTIWTDQLHPTSAVHDVFAMDIADFLYGVGASM
uniref:Carbohydrate esterase family 16 protein n=1 Tax=Schizophyllum commune (strain H4-8 / FGSC 9210) TaxID=578458 RepID=D8QEA2_SCHCM